MNNEAAFSQLRAHIEKVRTLPGMVQATPEMAEAVRDVFEAQIQAGTDSQGDAWQARQDGQKPLATAAQALAVVPVGRRIYARLKGHVARHHLRRAKGGIERAILPTGAKLPPKVARAILDSLRERFEAHMGSR